MALNKKEKNKEEGLPKGIYFMEDGKKYTPEEVQKYFDETRERIRGKEEGK